MLRFTAILLVSAQLLAGLAARAQAPAWQSVRLLAASLSGSSGGLTINATATADNGDTYLTGSCYGTVQLGGFTLTSNNSGSSTDGDFYVARYSNASHSVVWVVQAGGTNNEYANGIAVSGSSVYVAGTFYSSTLTLGSTTLTNTGAGSDGFLAKLTDAGTSAGFTWVQQVGGAGKDDAMGVAVTGNTVYVGGDFSGSALQMGATTLASAGGSDVYVARLADAGSSSSYIWAVRAGGAGQDNLSALALANGNLYLAGNNTGTASFGTATLAAEAAYVARLATTGSFDWATAVSGTGYAALRNIAVSGTSVYVGGNFRASSVTFGTTTLLTSGNSDVVVAKLTDAGSSGSWVWALGAGGSGDENAEGMAVSGSDVYLCGNYNSNYAPFGATVLYDAVPQHMVASLFPKVFVTHVVDAGSTGSFAWAQMAGGDQSDVLAGTAQALSINGSELLVWGRAFAGTKFGNLTLTGANNSYPNFVASLAISSALATASPAALTALSLYPNPAHGCAAVRLPAGATTAQLLDALGRVVRTATASAGTDCPLDLAGLAPGVYTLLVRAEKGAAAQKLVVE